MKKAAYFLAAWLIAACGSSGATPIVWVVPSSLLRAFQTDAPGGETTVRINCARGGNHPFQVAVQAPAGGLTSLDFFVSDLRGPEGANTKPGLNRH
jgi:hypothetical protein